MYTISKIEATEISDSRNNPTVSVTCTLKDNIVGTASVPSGASTGQHEAHELRDGDLNRFNGKGVLKAVQQVNTEIAPAIVGKEFDQETLDQYLVTLDGTEDKSRLGSNALLAISLAFARASANKENLPLYIHLSNIYFKNTKKKICKIPQPAFNIINGGKHSHSGLSFQEFMIIPQAFDTIFKKVEVAKNITISLKDLLLKDGYEINMGDEGGFAPALPSNEKALEYLISSISTSGYDTHSVKIGLDIAASTFFNEGHYNFENKKCTGDNMIEIYKDLCTHYPIISIEDGLYEEDFNGFKDMKTRLSEQINIVGDDLTVTNTKRIQEAIEKDSINTLLVKPNQIGTLSETFEAIKMAKENGIKIFLSHRSGETNDSFISDLAVAVDADFIKAGAPTRPERLAKYERLIQIENEI